MRAEIGVVFSLRGYELIPPQQDMFGEMGQFGASRRVHKVACACNRKIEAEPLAGRSRDDPVLLDTRRDPWRGEMEVEIAEAEHPLDRVGRCRGPRPAKADRPLPANCVG